MEKVMNALRYIQKELADQRNEIRQSAEKVTEQVTQNVTRLFEEKFQQLEEKFDNRKEKVENQEKRLYFLEKQARQNNLVFFGIEDKESSYANLESNFISFMKNNLSINVENRDVQEIRRLGKKGDRPRPILVKFVTLGLKIKILKQKSALKNSLYYIKEDYPNYVLEKRRELQEL